MTSGSLQRSVKEIASAHPEVEFALVLARTIDSLQSDPEQLRSAVYDLARHKLEQLAHDDPSEKKRLMQALEVAIAGVEAHTKNNPMERAALPPSRPIGLPRSEALIVRVDLDEADAQPVRGRSFTEPSPTPTRSRSRWSSSTPLRYLAMLLFFAGVVGLIVAQRRGWSPPPVERFVAKVWSARGPEAPAVPEASPAAASVLQANKQPERKPDPLVPIAYGVYAVSADRLYELQALQGRVPDPRVAISAAITRPSETTFADGRVRFVVFRRETPTSEASDPIELRVVAEVKQATNFDASGKPVVSSEQSWVIRNVSIPYRTAPLKDEPGMYQILPRDPNLVLPSGRYVLSLNGIGFDFSIEGKITDKRQCLERISAANGVFYSECQTP